MGCPELDNTGFTEAMADPCKPSEKELETLRMSGAAAVKLTCEPDTTLADILSDSCSNTSLRRERTPRPCQLFWAAARIVGEVACSGSRIICLT